MSTTLLKRLEQVAAVDGQRRARQAQDLAIFTDDEVEELCALAQNVETAQRLGQPVVWTAEERGVLDRLEAKRNGSQGW
jgi:hypothetical protein